MSWRLKWSCSHLNSGEKPSANFGAKKSQRLKIIIRVNVLPIVVDALRTVPKSLVKGREELEIRGRIETTALLKSARILRRVMETVCPQRWNEKLARSEEIIIIIIKILLDFSVSADHREKLRDLDREFKKKTMEHQGGGDIYLETRRFRNKWTSGDHPNYNILKIG